MVFELGEKGDLLSLLDEKGSLSEGTTKFLMAEVATTIRYLFCNLMAKQFDIQKNSAMRF